MSVSWPRGVLATLFIAGACLGAGAQAQTTPNTPSAAASATAASPAASAPTKKEKKKRESRAKTPPGKPPGGGHCEQGDKAQRQRCLNDMYGPGGPRL